MSQGTAIASTAVKALVDDAQQSYIDGEFRHLSMNTEGRLRVATVPAETYMEFFVPFDFGYPTDIRELSNSPWSALHE